MRLTNNEPEFRVHFQHPTINRPIVNIFKNLLAAATVKGSRAKNKRASSSAASLNCQIKELQSPPATHTELVNFPLSPFLYKSYNVVGALSSNSLHK